MAMSVTVVRVAAGPMRVAVIAHGMAAVAIRRHDRWPTMTKSVWRDIACVYDDAALGRLDVGAAYWRLYSMPYPTQSRRSTSLMVSAGQRVKVNPAVSPVRAAMVGK